MHFSRLLLFVVLLTTLSLSCAAAKDSVHKNGQSGESTEEQHNHNQHRSAEGNAHGEGHSAHGHHRFEDAEKWAGIFEDPTRDEWQKPEKVIDFLQIQPEMHVADIGSATGYFPIRIARRFSNVKVVGLDVEQTLVDYLNARAQREGLNNLTSRKVPFDDPQLDKNTDRVVVVDTYHHISDRVTYLKKLSANLSDDGTVVIVDFKNVELPFGGPPPEMRFSTEKVAEEFEAAGFVLDENDSKSLPYQYMLRFRKP